MQAIRIHAYGGPDQLRLESIEMPEPGPGQARVSVEAAGVNFIDIYHRLGLYPSQPPITPGMEAAGTVDAVGQDVTHVRVGDRVAYAMERGAYAEYALVDAWKLAPIPDEIESQQAAAVMLQGMTAHYLARDTFSLQPGHRALVHAAAGGVGLLLVQIARRCGAWVVGTVSTEEKAQLALAAGANEIIQYTTVDFEEEVRRLTDGEGVHVVYDSVGQTTFEKSLSCLRPRGLMALYGQSSGPVPPFNPQILNAKGSLFLTRPSLGHYTANRQELLARCHDLFGWMKAGELNVRVDTTFALSDAASAHRYMEDRKTRGKILLIP